MSTPFLTFQAPNSRTTLTLNPGLPQVPALLDLGTSRPLFIIKALDELKQALGQDFRVPPAGSYDVVVSLAPPSGLEAPMTAVQWQMLGRVLGNSMFRVKGVVSDAHDAQLLASALQTLVLSQTKIDVLHRLLDETSPAPVARPTTAHEVAQVPQEPVVDRVFARLSQEMKKREEEDVRRREEEQRLADEALARQHAQELAQVAMVQESLGWVEEVRQHQEEARTGWWEHQQEVVRESQTQASIVTSLDKPGAATPLSAWGHAVAVAPSKVVHPVNADLRETDAFEWMQQDVARREDRRREIREAMEGGPTQVAWTPEESALLEQQLENLSFFDGHKGSGSAHRASIEAAPGANEQLASDIIAKLPQEPVESSLPIEQAPPVLLTSRVVERRLRTGDVEMSEGDLTVVGHVSPGADVRAIGHIHVFGPFYGRAMAGLGGQKGAHVVIHEFYGQMVQIGESCGVFETLPDNLKGQAVKFWLEDDGRLHYARLAALRHTTRL